MKKTITLFIASVAVIGSSFAQSISPQVIGSTGSFVTANGYSLSFTVGEPATSTLFASSSIITQGFQQPNDVYTGIQTFNAPSLDAQLYPNPAVNEINLVLTSPQAGNYTVEVVDLLGRVLQQPLTTQLGNGQAHFTFNVQQLPASVYFITLQSTGSAIKHAFKFSKIN